MVCLCKFGQIYRLGVQIKCGQVSFYRGCGILVSFLVLKSLHIYVYKCSKYLEYILFHLEVQSEVF